MSDQNDDLTSTTPHLTTPERDPAERPSPTRRRRAARRPTTAEQPVDVQPADVQPADAQPADAQPTGQPADATAPEVPAAAGPVPAVATATEPAGDAPAAPRPRRRRATAKAVPEEATAPAGDVQPAAQPAEATADLALTTAPGPGPDATPEPAADTPPELTTAPAAGLGTGVSPHAVAEPTRTPRRSTRRAAAPLTFQAPVPVPVPEPAIAELGLDGEELADDDEDIVTAIVDDIELETPGDPDAAPDGDQDDDGEDGPRRRRRRGRRGRGRGGAGTGAETEDATGQELEAAGTGTDLVDPFAPPAQSAGTGDTGDTDEGDDDATAEEGDGTASGTRRRRRRRRSGGGGGGAGPAEPSADDPPNTVVRVREPRPRRKGEPDEDGVRGLSGSTRLEARRQRRRDGRPDRKRVPIVTEAEYLARRESVERTMVVRNQGERTQIAVLEDGVLVEHYVTRASSASYSGNVYLGKVQTVLPSMEAAFVDIGKGRNAVLYAGEVNYDTAGVDGGRAHSIQEALKAGQNVLVQVTKDPMGHKGARLTSQITLPGRYLVYVPEGSMTGISRKLPDTERARLKAILKRIVPDDAGVIIRTAAEGAPEDALVRDVERLQQQWTDMQAKAKKAEKSAPALVHAEPDLVVRVVRDIFNEDFGSLVVQGDAEWATIEAYVSGVAPELMTRAARWTGSTDVFSHYRVDEQLVKALDRKVHLPSGGSLVIDRTEAMTVVDVNTGRFTGKGGNLEETVTKNNLEAAEEIVRQLRLRDVGGMIVVDFIDMVLESNRDLVLRRLTECLGRDRTRHQVAEVTSLGLVQMTRKRVGTGLIEAYSETCAACNGRGVLVHMDGPPVHTQSAPVSAPAPMPPVPRPPKQRPVPTPPPVAATTPLPGDVTPTAALPADAAGPANAGSADAAPVDAEPVATEPAATELAGARPAGAGPAGAGPADAEPAATVIDPEAAAVVNVLEPALEPPAAAPAVDVPIAPPVRRRRRATSSGRSPVPEAAPADAAGAASGDGGSAAPDVPVST